MFSPSTAADFKILSASFLALSIDLLIDDFSKNLEIKKPSTRVFYDLQSIGHPSLEDVIDTFLVNRNILAKSEMSLPV